MKHIILTAILLSASISFADIPSPPRGGDVEQRDIQHSVIEGDAAAALWESADVSEIRGDSLRNGGSSHKVLRAKDGLDQVICTKTYRSVRAEKTTTYRCRTETSLDGEKLKKFVPAIRLGSAVKPE